MLPDPDSTASFNYNLFSHRLPWLRVTGRNGDVPEVAGVYAVYAGGYLVYVGSSVNLRKRLRAYGKRELQQFSDGFARVLVCKHSNVPLFFKVKLAVREGEWLMREWRLIRRLQPNRNRAGVTSSDITTRYWWPKGRL